MLRHTSEFHGIKLHATDGDLGKLVDFYFDDRTWTIRYGVVETGSWLLERQVLLSPRSFRPLDKEKRTLAVELTCAQIAGSPPMDLHLPVSRQYEKDYHTYYNWPYYWSEDVVTGFGAYPAMVQPTPAEEEARAERHLRDDPHLRSTQSVIGYEIETTDGTVGSVSNFLVDETTWMIPHLVVETGHWFAGHEILIPIQNVLEVDYAASKVRVNLSREELSALGTPAAKNAPV